MSLFGNFGDLYKKKDHLVYADDYEDELYEDEHGKTRRRVTYIGPYIPVRNDARSLRFILIGVILLTAMTAAGIGAGMLINHTTGWWFFTTVPVSIAAFPCLYLIMGTLHLPYSGKPLQRDAYMHGMVRMLRSCGAIIVLSAVTLAAEFLFRIIHSDWLFLRGDIAFMLILFGIMAACIGIIFLIRAIDVDELDLKINDVAEVK